ncbi:MAG: hypothetical protein SFV52_05685 [Saprospiraceae bacterium]|nr:hypothetical protein [Saprospiraceae bacterium]
MRNLLISALLLGLWNCSSPAQNKLDGRAFKIENFTGGKSEGVETMTFKAGKVENDVCTQWGFGSSDYSCDADGKFRYTLTSEKEGRMDWEGQVTGNTVSGKMVWVKAGQDDIHYTFKGEEVK